MYRGDINLGDTIDLKFTTRSFSTGAPFTLAGTPVISAYVDNSTTEITAGITLTVDFDARTGLNNVRVVASSGNGYAAGTNVHLVVTTGTVNGVSVVGEVIGSFSIAARSALRPATAGRTLVVDAAGLADANMVKAGPTGSGTAQTARDIGGAVPAAAPGASGGLFIAGTNAATTVTTSFTSTFTGNLTGNVGGNVAGSVGSVTGAVGSVTGNVGGNVAGSVASVTAQLTAAQIGDAVLDEVVEGSRTLRQLIRGYSAALLAKASGLATTTAVFRDIDDSKDRITATVDANGNRSAITLDLT